MNRNRGVLRRFLERDLSIDEILNYYEEEDEYFENEEEVMEKEIETSKKIAYRPITVPDLGDVLGKYIDMSSYETACKLMLDEGLLILKKDDSILKDDSAK